MSELKNADFAELLKKTESALRYADQMYEAVTFMQELASKYPKQLHEIEKKHSYSQRWDKTRIKGTVMAQLIDALEYLLIEGERK